MAYQVKINGLGELEKSLRGLESQIPYAAREALNTTAFIVRRGLKLEMEYVFDRPTKFVTRGIWVTKATKTNLSVKIWINENNQGYYDDDDTLVKIISPHIFGGRRSFKGFEKTLYRKGLLKRGEFMVPGRSAPKDSYGNIRRGEYQRMLSQIGAFAEQGTQQNATSDPSRRRYIWGEIAGTKGIWRVTRDRWVPYLIVAKNNPTYRKRFDFFGESKEMFDDSFPRAAANAVDRAIATAR